MSEDPVPGQLVLLPDVEPHPRSLVPVPAQDAVRPVVDLRVAGGRL